MPGSREQLLRGWRERWEGPVVGWDFSEFGDGFDPDEPPWQYEVVARGLLQRARHVLDLGTGGGEVLLRLADALPPDTVATEGWAVNLPVATAALQPHAIAVVRYDAEADDRLPFDDRRFDLVLDRHEAYDAQEVWRVLRDGGIFCTQQVDGRDAQHVRQLFGADSIYADVTLERCRDDLEQTGFDVERAETWLGTLTFPDIAMFVRYLAFVPWEAPDDFSVERYAEVLLSLHEAIDAGTPLVVPKRRFLLVARRA